ncbi:MAG: CocE/NonD family hydrolase [Pseudomonadota bacterium]
MPEQLDRSRRRALATLAAGSGLPALATFGGCAAATPAEPGAAQIVEHQSLRMADGVQLSARLWIPPAAERTPVPIVLEYIPYRKRDLYRGIDDFFGAMLSTAGIGFARVDVRGSGDSEGLLQDEYTDQELNDGVAVIAQLANLRWCNGQVGLRGLSWGAINALLLAARRPPALAAVLAMAGTDDRSRDDAHFLGGVVGKPNLDWGLTFRLVAAAPPDPAVFGPGWLGAWTERLEAAGPVLASWFDRRARIPEWHARRLDVRAIDVPVLLVAGWQDPYAVPMRRLKAVLGAQAELIVGAWGHTYPSFAAPNGVRWAEREIAWWRGRFDAAPKTAANGFDAGASHLFLGRTAPRAVHPQAIAGAWYRLPAEPLPPRRRYGLGTRSAALVRLDRSFQHAAAGGARPEWLEVLPGPQQVHGQSAFTHVLEVGRSVEFWPEGTVLNGRFRLRGGPAAVWVRLILRPSSTGGAAWLLSDAIVELGFDGATGTWQRPAADTWFEQRIAVPAFGMLVPAGARIELRIDPAPWPLTLPLPGQAVVEFDPSASALTCWPLAAGELEVSPLESRDAPAPPLTDPAPLTHRADGALAYQRSVASAPTTVAATQTVLAGGLREEALLFADGGFRYQAQRQRSWSRPGWQPRVEVTCEVSAASSGSDQLRVRETTRGWAGERLVHAVEHDSLVPR